MSFQCLTTRNRIHLVFILLLLLSLSLPSGLWADAVNASGQDNSSSVQPDKDRQELQKVMKRAKALRTKLQDIQQQTLTANQALSEQQNNLQQAFQEAMQNNLKELEVDVDRLKEISQEVKQQDLSQEERDVLRKEFQNLATGYQKAKNKTLANKDLQAMNQAFSQKLLAAMKKHNPDTQSILQELEVLRAEIRAAQQSAGMN